MCSLLHVLTGRWSLESACPGCAKALAKIAAYKTPGLPESFTECWLATVDYRDEVLGHSCPCKNELRLAALPDFPFKKKLHFEQTC